MLQGLKAAKDLIANYPNAKLESAGHFYQSLGRVLEQYPAAVVAECVDPVNGLARRHKWVPTLADVTEWCDARLRFYQVMSQYRPLPPPRLEPPVADAERAKVGELLTELAHRLRSTGHLEGKPRFQPHTDAELLAKYPPREPAPEPEGVE